MTQIGVAGGLFYVFFISTNPNLPLFWFLFGVSITIFIWAGLLTWSNGVESNSKNPQNPQKWFSYLTPTNLVLSLQTIKQSTFENLINGSLGKPGWEEDQPRLRPSEPDPGNTGAGILLPPPGILFGTF